EIDADLQARALEKGHALSSFQSNAEHALVDRVQAARDDGTDFILVNPAGFTHTSVALRDALAAVAIPFIEVHLSNPHAREPFRRQSYFSDLAVGVVCGFGALGYGLALVAASRHLEVGNRGNAGSPRATASETWSATADSTRQTTRGLHGPAQNQEAHRPARGIQPRRNRDQGGRGVRAPGPHAVRRCAGHLCRARHGRTGAAGAVAGDADA